MGNRTVVILYNDQAGEWENDPDLGKKISAGMNYVHLWKSNPHRGDPADLGYGRVVECAHADDQTLAFLEGYRFHRLAHSFYQRDDGYDALKLRLLQAWADGMGFKLVKKPVKEEK
jgi:hypothetical protein